MANHIPSWFNSQTYLDNKLEQVKSLPDTPADYDMADLIADFGAAGYSPDNTGSMEDAAWKHFNDYGANEEVSANPNFDAEEYYAAKAAQFYNTDETPVSPADVTPEQIAIVKQLISEAGFNAWSHYQAYGSSEGVNPSNDFDESAYLEAKAAAMNANGTTAPGGGQWDADSVRDAITAAGMSTIEHYSRYAGTSDNEVAAPTPGVSQFPVPDAERAPVIGETFNLQPATAGFDVVVGTNYDDTINARAYDNSGVLVQSLTSNDNIDGGDGWDTLNLYHSGDVFTGVTMNNVEVVNNYFEGTATLDVTAGTVSGIKEVWQHGASGATTTTANSSAQIGFVGANNGGAQTITFKDAATATDATIALKGATTGALGVAGIENLTVKSSGTSTTGALTATNAVTVNIENTGDLTVSGLTIASGTNVVVNSTGNIDLGIIDAASGFSFDGSASTGDITFTTSSGDLTADSIVVTGAGNDTIEFVTSSATKSVDLGAGDDTLIIDKTDLSGLKSVNGGEGNDTLMFGTASLSGGLSESDISEFSGFEVLGLDGIALGASSSGSGVDASALGFTKFATEGGASFFLTNVSSDNEFNIGTGTVGASSVAMGGAGPQTLNLNLVGDSSGIVDFSSGLEVTSINTVNVSSTGENASGNKLELKLVAQNTAINISGDKDLTLTFNSADTGNIGIDASAFTGVLDVVGNSGNNVITGGSGNDKIAGGAGIDIINGGAGDDTFVLGSGDQGLDTYTGGEGSDTYDLDAIAVYSGNEANLITITDFAGGAGGDILDVSGISDVSGGFGGKITLDGNGSDIADAISGLAGADSGLFAVDGINVVEFADGATYLVIDGGASGFTVADDMVIDITGATGEITAENFIFA